MKDWTKSCYKLFCKTFMKVNSLMIWLLDVVLDFAIKLPKPYS